MKSITMATLAMLLISLMGGCDRTTDKPTDTKTEPRTTLKPFEFLIDWQAEPTYLGVYYAKHIGAFAELGLDASIVQSWGANESASAIAAGRYLIGTASGGATVIANSSGAELLSTAVLYQTLPTAIYGLTKTGIKKPQDLKGKTVGVYAKSITVEEFNAFKKLNGLNEEDINTVSISGPDLPLILTGRVDAVLNYFELSPTQLALEHETFELLLSEYGVEGYGLNIITSREAYQKQPDLAEGITRAVLQGYRKGCADRDAAVAAFLAEFPEKDPEYVRQSWNKVCAWIGGEYGKQTKEGWQRTIDLYASLGLLRSPVTPEQIMPGQK